MSAQENGEDKPIAAPAEYASPADTLNTFLVNVAKVAKDQTDADAKRRLFGTMNLAPSVGDTVRFDKAFQLWNDVFNRIIEIDAKKHALTRQEIEGGDIKRFEFLPNNPRLGIPWERLKEDIETLPSQPIEFVRTDTGAWKFSEQSLSPETLNTWSDALSTVKEVVEADVEYQSLSQSVRNKMPAALKGRYFLGVEYWQWVGLAAVIFLAVLVDFMSRIPLQITIKRLTSRYVGEADDSEIAATVRPVGLIVGATAFVWLFETLGVTGPPGKFLGGAGRLICIFGVAWTAWAMADLLSAAFLKRAAKTESQFDDMIVPLLRKSAKLFIIAMSAIYVADLFEWQLMPLLGSVGIAGLAISFAAQDMVKNLFGGITIFLDQPFKIGERVVYKGYDGIIEEVGFRVTRLRTLTGHLVTIPNGGITSEPVENIGRRPSIRRVMNVTITYDTPKDKIEQAVQIIKDILEEPDIAEPIHKYIGADLMVPRVYFNDLASTALNIFVIYWYIPPSYWDYMQHAEKVNLRIFEEFEKAGLEFAFPTQTVYLAGDPNRQLAVRTLGEQG